MALISSGSLCIAAAALGLAALFVVALTSVAPDLGRDARRAPLDVLAGTLAFVVAACVIIAPLASARHPGMTDLPFHAAQASVLAHFDDPDWHFREQFRLQPFVVPYLSHYVIAAALLPVTSAATAIRVSTAILLGLLPAGLATLLRGLHKSPLFALASLPLAYGTLAHWGFISHLGALGLFAMAVGLALQLVERPSRGRQLGLAAVLVVLFCTHVFRFPFALAGVLGAAIARYPGVRRIRPVLLPVALGAGLFLAWNAVRPPAFQFNHLEVHPERMTELFGLLVDGFTDPEEGHLVDRWAGVVLLAAAASTVIALVDRTGRRTRRARWDAAGRVAVPLACTAVFLGLFLAMPMQMGVWWYVYPREATSAAVLGLAALPALPRRRWLRWPLAAALAAVAIQMSLFVAGRYAAIDADAGDFERVLGRIPKAPRLLYLVFDHQGTTTRTSPPYLHQPAYVQAERGGFLSFHFAMWGASPVAYRSPGEPGAVVPPQLPVHWEWYPEVFRVEEHAAFFDWFLVRRVGSPDHLFAPDPRIVPVDHAGEWWLYRRLPAGEEAESTAQ